MDILDNFPLNFQIIVAVCSITLHVQNSLQLDRQPGVRYRHDGEGGRVASEPI